MNMRKLIGILAGLCAAVGLAATVWAVEPVRLVVTAPGAVTYRLTSRAMRLTAVEVFKASATTGTVTVSQIADGLTNAVAAITLSSSAGSATNLAVWVFPGDVLSVAYTVGATTAVVRYTGELNP